MSGFAAPSPGQVPHEAGVLVRIHVKGAGTYASGRTTLDHAREIALAFMADLVAALAPGADMPFVPFQAGGSRVDLMVRADQVCTVEVTRVDRHGGQG